ncbi:MAG: phosphoribosylamine--glycine ligase [Ruminococcaceae bacterium]|nr:phosphoribosylamine--glycine ligase [Oscillospiraceae bacterium]
MKVLVVGGGGREHTIIWKLAQSPHKPELFAAPGNGGISKLATCVDIKATDVEGVVQFAKENSIDLTVVAPDDPLMLGMVDRLEAEGLRAFGPRQNAAIIEGSKVFSKDLMKKYGIPTAAYEVFDNSEEALSYLQTVSYPTVIKAEGLALGKGVIIAADYEEAKATVRDIMCDRVFGEAGSRVVIEEFLTGQEVSVLAFTDGKTLCPMVSAQDHKRAYDHDEGPNTGGMGTFSPSRLYSEKIHEECMKNIFIPTMKAMNQEGRTFKGVLYFGLIMTKDGVKVIEYNARFGDPETQVVLPRLQTDLLEIFMAVAEERLKELTIEWTDNAAVCVVLASGGYPKAYAKGLPIHGIETAEEDKDITVFHAGTAWNGEQLLTAGGRVLGVTAVGPNLEKAINKAYEGASKIYFDKVHYRRDIGRK